MASPTAARTDRWSSARIPSPQQQPAGQVVRGQGQFTPEHPACLSTGRRRLTPNPWESSTCGTCSWEPRGRKRALACWHPPSPQGASSLWLEPLPPPRPRAQLGTVILAKRVLGQGSSLFTTLSFLNKPLGTAAGDGHPMARGPAGAQGSPHWHRVKLRHGACRSLVGLCWGARQETAFTSICSGVRFYKVSLNGFVSKSFLPQYKTGNLHT